MIQSINDAFVSITADLFRYFLLELFYFHSNPRQIGALTQRM